ncbi:PDZ domain-containing protein [Clostridium lundense]|uniref:PDZ domain-containing protein n=1 Tax=Clostridium lundense TaxID=319475 RepID=UPI00048366BA|nr:PDZ domain-containing protein [Clostridium lundense]
MNIVLYTLKAVAFALTNPYLVFFLVIISIFLYMQNKKTSAMQKMIIGEQINSPFELTISQLVMGIFGGVLSSIIMAYFGVTFYQNSAIEILFLISVFLTVVNPRFICFSYSGAILGALSIINSLIASLYGTKEIQLFKFDIASLMTMIAVLHFVEGLLIITDGSRGTVPVFTKREDKIIGGFVMKRYWVVPIALFIILSGNYTLDMADTVPMPNWWPIIHTTIPLEILKKSIVMLIPFYGMLGYNSITFTKTKRAKVNSSGFLIIAYSIALFVLAQLCYISIIYKILVVLFAPIAHEGIIYLQRYNELNEEPLYVSEEGIKVLEVAPYSPADSMNIKSGDSLIGINDREIEKEEDILEMIKNTQGDMIFKIKKINGVIREVTYGEAQRKNRLGIVFVPKYIPKDKVVVKVKEDNFSDVLNKIKNKDKDGDE